MVFCVRGSLRAHLVQLFVLAHTQTEPQAMAHPPTTDPHSCTYTRPYTRPFARPHQLRSTYLPRVRGHRREGGRPAVVASASMRARKRTHASSEVADARDRRAHRLQSLPGVCGQGVHPQVPLGGLFFGSHECGAVALSCGPGMHMGPRAVGAIGMRAHCELAGWVPVLTMVGA